MTLARLLTAWALALTFAACTPADKAAATVDPGAKTIVIVNGKKITASMLDTFVKAAAGRPASELDPESRKEAIDAMIDMQVLAAEGQKQGLDKKGEAAASIALARINVLQRAVADAYLKDKSPTDQELRAEYDALVAKMPRSEYSVRHILLQNETFANEILARLKAGERFETLARQSLDPSSKDGGDLGWSPANRYVAPFAEALLKLKKGETTAAPVRSQFGWHIIRLDDVRDTTPPPPRFCARARSHSFARKCFIAVSSHERNFPRSRPTSPSQPFSIRRAKNSWVKSSASWGAFPCLRT